MNIALHVIFTLALMHHGKNLYIMRHNQDTGLHAWNVIFLQKDMATCGQKGQQACVIYGASGQRILHHLTGKTAEGLRLPVDMFMRSAA